MTDLTWLFRWTVLMMDRLLGLMIPLKMARPLLSYGAVARATKNRSLLALGLVPVTDSMFPLRCRLAVILLLKWQLGLL